MGDLICGLKLTHDGGVAVIDGDHLLFCVEAEKLDNRPRYAPLNVARDLAGALSRYSLSAADLTAVAIDGWSRDRDGVSHAVVIDDAGNPTSVDVAGYVDQAGAVDELLAGHCGSAPLFGSELVPFRSFTHATDHALSSYCTSPFAAAGERALVLAWDGGMPPCLYQYDPARGRFESYGPVMPVSGGLYPIFASHFPPFRLTADIKHGPNPMLAAEMQMLPISGKAMAYTALGEPDEDVMTEMAAVTRKVVPIDGVIRSYMWSGQVLNRLRGRNVTDATLLASFQEHLYRLLADALRDAVAARPELRDLPICLSGGCALNIKWNSRLRAGGLFREVWVPPFPNDAGSAIGAACAGMIRQTGQAALRWSVFSGPEAVATTQPEPGWTARPYPLEELARILADEGEPVVVIEGRAELGPRALGHRSIIAPATDAGMCDRLNKMKEREWYRPVAPICLAHRAAEVFTPGDADPYMLFDRAVRSDWRNRVPAIVHADGSARLQTVGPDNDIPHRLLTAYERLTGVPVLCNTSANFKGSGFFPDAASAMRWGRARYVWSDGTLFQAVRPWDGG